MPGLLSHLRPVRAWSGLLALAVLVAACSMRAPVVVPSSTVLPTDLGAGLVTERPFPSLSYGIHAFLWWNETTRDRDLEFVRMLRFQYVKQIFGWRDIFPDPDQPPDWTRADAVVDEVAYRELRLIARLGKPPDWALRTDSGPDEPPIDAEAFSAYCGALAARYRGRIAGYQVWNEPNLDREWAGRTPSAAGYVRLLAPCYRAIKAADPAAVIISAGLAPTGTFSPQAIPDDVYLTQLYEAGMMPYYDVLGLNAPGYRSPPETPPDDPALDGHRWQAFRHVEDMRAIMVAHGEGHKQIAILEMGWTVDARDSVPDPAAAGQMIPNPYRWHAVTEQQQADYLVGAYSYAAEHWRPWVGLMTTIYLPDPDWTPDDEEYWWALMEPGYTVRMRQAYFDLANAPRFIDDLMLPPILDGVNPYTPMPPRPRSP